MAARSRASVALGAAVVLTGVGAGLAGAVLTLFLHAVQHLAYGYSDEAFLVGSMHAPPARRVLAMTVAGAVVGVGWWLLRRLSPTVPSVTAALASPGRHLRMVPTWVDALLQLTAVGAGASLGREGAPRQVAAALAEGWARMFGLDDSRRRTLLACGAGAGLAAVYNVPLGGAIFALEILLRTVTLDDALIALVTSGIATAVAWPIVGRQPTYVVPALTVPWTLIVGSVLLGPVAGLVGWAFRHLTTAARLHAPTGWRLPATTTVLFAAVGALAVVLPEVLGNGKGPAALAFTGGLPLTVLAALLVAKPLATAACLRSGAVGGLLTPAVATGAVLGALGGAGWALLWPGSPPGAFAIVGAAAVLATTQRAPLTAAVLAVEFTHSSLTMLVPIALAVGGAVVLSHAVLDLRGRQTGTSPSAAATMSRSSRRVGPGVNGGRQPDAKTARASGSTGSRDDGSSSMDR
ncbi:MAG TPA: chloride channel protein [Blastococcus sp.]|nr:chloride channel protein [Blastococcus sp.]